MSTPPHSIRWRLPLSYAGIALLTALALGAVLLVSLRGYYWQREQAYLEERARLLSAIVTPELQRKADPATLQQLVTGSAFLAQARVQIHDVNGQLLADSGSPQPSALFNLPLTPAVTLADGGPNQVRLLISSQPITHEVGRLRLGAGITRTIILSRTAPATDGQALEEQNLFFTAPAPDFFMVRDLADSVDQNEQRSTQRVRRPLAGEQGQTIGYLQLSEGPAYGRQIVRSAAQGLVIAGAIALGLAAVAGLWVSRQINRPLAQLTTVTAQMAAGDLSARATVATKDELGLLARLFNEMAQQVEDTVQALRRFVADAAHELNTPLTALRTNLELDAPSPLGSARLEQVMRLETLVQNLLTLSRLDAHSSAPPVGRVDAQGPFDLTHLVRELCEPYASRAEQHDIAFSLATPATLLLIEGGRSLVAQALVNLLDNALKFSQPGGAIFVELRQDGESAYLVVEDRGIGIPAGEASLLFQRFYRASNATAYPGNGLGLAIVKAIVEQQGGSVQAEGKEQGMRVTVRLPLLTA